MTKNILWTKSAFKMKQKTFLIICEGLLGGDYIIPAGQDEILSRFDGPPAVS